MKKGQRMINGLVVILFAAVSMAQGQVSDYLFSTDIGSDLDQSDPVSPGGTMDAGDIYRPGTPGNPMLWKDDDQPTPQWPGHPFATGTAPQPLPTQIGTSTIEEYHTVFDLDAEDQVKNEEILSNLGSARPLEELENAGIYSIRRQTQLSYDDDGPNGWAVSGDVPTTAAPDRAVEIHGTMLSAVPSAATATPLITESMLSLDPDPPGIDHDDDVDALDWHPLFDDPSHPDAFQARYFSPDHEADLGLDPGSIYLTSRNPAGANLVLAFDDVNNFGLLEETDVDAFEFVALDEEWAALLGINLQAGEWTAGAIFSVDQDDLDTVGIDESGGLNPNIIYLTDLNGNYVAASGIYEDDIDALTVIPEPAVLALVGLFGGGLIFIRRWFMI